MSKLGKSILTSLAKSNEDIQELFISSRKVNESRSTRETAWFNWSDKSTWPIKSGQCGVYIFKFNGIYLYVGQGKIYARLVLHLSKFKKLLNKYRNKKAPKNKTGDRWSVVYKIFNMSNYLNKWHVKCITFNTGNVNLDKYYAKHLEDQIINDYDLIASGFNEKTGDIT